MTTAWVPAGSAGTVNAVKVHGMSFLVTATISALVVTTLRSIGDVERILAEADLLMAVDGYPRIADLEPSSLMAVG